MSFFNIGNKFHTCSTHNYTGTKECPDCKLDNLLHEVMLYYDANINDIVHERFIIKDKQGKIIKNYTITKRKLDTLEK